MDFEVIFVDEYRNTIKCVVVTGDYMILFWWGPQRPTVNVYCERDNHDIALTDGGRGGISPSLVESSTVPIKALRDVDREYDIRLRAAIAWRMAFPNA